MREVRGMNQERFDDLTRALATTPLSRWQVLKALAAGTFLGLTGAASRPVYGAPPPGKGPCREPRVKCHGVCCLTGQDCVDGRCLTLGTHDNCAGVGDMCAPNETCCCDPELPPGLLCNCINLFSDNINHCGACDNPCSGPYDACCGGFCRDLNSEEENCGSCGNDCPGTTICQEGKCQCPPGLIDCSGTCVDTSTNKDNCGSCGNVCGQNQVCGGGQCHNQCPQGLTECNGQCVDTVTNPNNCGSCGNVCGNGQTCQGGQCQPECQVTCNPPQVLNPDTCACECPITCPPDQHLNPATCECEGACDPPCGPCESCQDGTCVPVDCGSPCLECREGACFPKECGDCETCNPQTGACESTCGSCQTCDGGQCRNCNQCETCESGSCVPIPDAKPCGDACCGSCQTCEGGQCRNCNQCETCENGTCVPIACGTCQKCDNGVCRYPDQRQCEACEDGEVTPPRPGGACIDHVTGGFGGCCLPGHCCNPLYFLCYPC